MFMSFATLSGSTLIIRSENPMQAFLMDAQGLRIGSIPPGVTFRPLDHYQGFPLVMPPPCTGTPALDRLMDDLVHLDPAKHANIEAAKTVLKVILLAPVLGPRCDVRPLTILVGIPGSGKTYVARIFGRVWMGPEFEVTGLPRSEWDWLPALDRTGIVALDNLEAAPTWFPDVAARLVTGSRFDTREYYTTAGVMSFQPDCWPFATAVHPATIRGDLLDRSVIFRLVKPATLIEGQLLLQRVDSDRPALIGEILRAAEGAMKILTSTPTTPPTFRLTGFQIIGRALSFAAWGQAGLDLFEQGLVDMKEVRTTLAAECDPLLAGLLVVAADPVLAGQWMHPTGLLDEIARVSGNNDGFTQTHGEITRFGAALKSLMVTAAGLVVIEQRRTAKGVQYMVKMP